VKDMKGISTGKFEKKRPTFGLLCTHLDGMYQSPLWRGMADFAETHDVNLIIFVGKNLKSPVEFEAQENIIYDLVNIERLDGLAVSPLMHYVGMKEMLEVIKPFRSIPIVSISYLSRGITSVAIDNKAAMRSAIEHLIEVHGYRRIAFICGPEPSNEAQLRFQAYQEVLAEHDIPFDQTLVTPGDFRFEAGREAVQILVDERKVQFDAIAAASDYMALAALESLQVRGFQVPGDIAVTGFDDAEDIRFIWPSMTTIRQPVYKLSYRAGELLFAMLSGQTVSLKNIIPTELMVRHSCGCIPDHLGMIVDRDFDKDDYPEKSLEPVFQNNRANGNGLYSNREKDIIQEVLERVMEIPEQERYESLQLIQRFIEALLTDIKQGRTSSDFLILFENLINQYVIIHETKNDWHNILLNMQSAIHKHLPQISTKHLEMIFYAAHIIVSEAVQHREGFKRIQLSRRQMQLRSFIHDMNSSYNVTELLKIITHRLPELGIPGCYLILYQTPVRQSQNGTRVLPKTSKLIMAYNQTGWFISEDNAKLFPTRDIYPNGVIPADKRFTLIAQPLYSRTQHFGFLLSELGVREEMVYNTVQEQIGTALNTVLLFNKRKHSEEKLKIALADLKKSNRKLQSLSLEDELTGLYNRRGFFLLAEQHYRFCRREGRKFVVFFGDIDGLKMINDLYGHREGDHAIRQTARILKNTFRESDIIGRYGGDEFIVIGLNDSKETISATQKRFRENMAKCNQNLNKPYEVSISLGAAEYDIDSSLSLEELITAADQKLYEEKLAKKQKAITKQFNA
jgi:diguanylate cyclase (GGDEF)-like protein